MSTAGGTPLASVAALGSHHHIVRLGLLSCQLQVLSTACLVAAEYASRFYIRSFAVNLQNGPSIHQFVFRQQPPSVRVGTGRYRSVGAKS
jgi:hypothetical protein